MSSVSFWLAYNAASVALKYLIVCLALPEFSPEGTQNMLWKNLSYEWNASVWLHHALGCEGTDWPTAQGEVPNCYLVSRSHVIPVTLFPYRNYIFATVVHDLYMWSTCLSVSSDNIAYFIECGGGCTFYLKELYIFVNTVFLNKE